MSVALITGASRGMGLWVARELAERGMTVVAGVRDPEELAVRLEESGLGSEQQDAERATHGPGRILPVALDVTDELSVGAAVREVERSTSSLDVLVNNAGISGPFTDPQDVVPDDFDAVLRTNLLGPVRVTHAFLPLLRRGDRPRLVMVSSGMGSLTLQATDPIYSEIAHLPYPATKAALNMLVVQYAKTLTDVIVTAVDPGLTATEFTAGAGQPLSEGGEAILAAALDTTGPSGRFRNRLGLAPW